MHLTQTTELWYQTKASVIPIAIVGSSFYNQGLELCCQYRLEGVALGRKQQLSDWQLLITATRQNRTVKYYPSPLDF